MQVVKTHSQISFTSALMWIFHGEKHEGEKERVFCSMWSPMARTGTHYRDFGHEGSLRCCGMNGESTALNTLR